MRSSSDVCKQTCPFAINVKLNVMTASRIVRGNKGRVFLYICGILVIVGIIACYNNTRVQLEDVRRTNEMCRKQQENLSSQLQGKILKYKGAFSPQSAMFSAIFEYKQRLEKSLKAEKADHQQTKSDLENKVNEEKTQHEKETSEAKIRFTSLQKHNKLLDVKQNRF